MLKLNWLIGQKLEIVLSANSCFLQLSVTNETFKHRRHIFPQGGYFLGKLANKTASFQAGECDYIIKNCVPLRGRPGLLSHKLAQNCLIWNIFVVLSKISLMGHFFHSVFVKKYKFHIKTLKNWEMWIFESHYALKHVRGQWISKIYVSQYFQILI